MAELIATTSAEATSADFTLADGASTSIYLKDAQTTNDIVPENSAAFIQVKSGSKYITIGSIDRKNPIAVLAAPGTFRVYKPLSSYPVGVDRS